MAGDGITIRPARREDIEVMATIEQECWPAPLAASAEQLAARMNAFPEGQLVGEQHDGQLLGLITAQRVRSEFLAQNSESYQLLTDNGYFTRSHDPQGDVYQLVGVAVLPKKRGSKLGRDLVDRQIEYARSLPDVNRIIGFTRPVRFHKYARDMSIDAYLEFKRPTGILVDPVVGFHAHAGAAVVSVHENFRPSDTESCGYGVLIEYAKQVAP